MSRCNTQTDPDEPRGAERIYSEHPDTVDELAERDDRIGAVFQAIKGVATEGGHDAE